MKKVDMCKTPTYEWLKWDSDFFGFPIARIRFENATAINADEISRMLREIGDHGGNLVYLEYPYEENQPPMEIPGSGHVDTKVIYSLDLKAYHSPSDNPGIKTFEGEGELLYELAYASGHESRFKLDKRFGEENFRRLYRAWIDNSLRGEIASHVLISGETGDPTGLLTLDTRPAEASIGLLAVRSDYRNRGIGRNLMEAAKSESKAAGCERLSVATQLNNRGACMFYEREGFRVSKITYIHHIWL